MSQEAEIRELRKQLDELQQRVARLEERERQRETFRLHGMPA